MEFAWHLELDVTDFSYFRAQIRQLAARQRHHQDAVETLGGLSCPSVMPLSPLTAERAQGSTAANFSISEVSKIRKAESGLSHSEMLRSLQERIFPFLLLLPPFASRQTFFFNWTFFVVFFILRHRNIERKKTLGNIEYERWSFRCKVVLSNFQARRQKQHGSWDAGSNHCLMALLAPCFSGAKTWLVEDTRYTANESKRYRCYIKTSINSPDEKN